LKLWSVGRLPRQATANTIRANPEVSYLHHATERPYWKPNKKSVGVVECLSSVLSSFRRVTSFGTRIRCHCSRL
jgi:hypothetical protein